jgi:hypothetical protein
MKKKRSLKEVLLYAGPATEAGKGDLAPMKIDMKGMQSDEEALEGEQAELYKKRKLRALKMMGQ